MEFEKYINKKHLLIVGKSAADRKTMVDKVLAQSNRTAYRFKSGIESFDEYIKQVSVLFPFVPPEWHEQNPKKWTLNQVWDFHLDWTDRTSEVLIVLEAFHGIEESSKIEIIRDYLMTSYHQESPKKSSLNFQLIMTLEKEDNLLRQLESVIGLNENDGRTPEQFISGKIELVNLD